MNDYKQAIGSTNCMQCAVAYILRLRLDQVPDFTLAGSAQQGWEAFEKFFESQGFAAIMFPGNHTFEADYLACGTSPRGVKHMVVMNDGKLLHDPHPNGGGITDIQCVWLLTPKRIKVEPPPPWDGVIRPADFVVETFSGVSFGMLYRPATGVRITHTPTGMREEANESSRSVHWNKSVAWERLEARLILRADAVERGEIDTPKPAPAAEPQATDNPPPFQPRVMPWMIECFGGQGAVDKAERTHRFLEEALELAQACGATAEDAHKLVDYTFGRPVGVPFLEAGGTMVTLASLCIAHGFSMHEAGEAELARVSTPEMIAKIRAKRSNRPPNSPLPGH